VIAPADCSAVKEEYFSMALGGKLAIQRMAWILTENGQHECNRTPDVRCMIT